jgi:uncharacterized membrane protein (GlpM family)
MQIFWGCFIALITTSTAFITRAILVSTVWPREFGLDAVKAQELFGAGIWPFAISIILFSFFIDKIGYKAAMVFSAICYVLYAVMALMAYSTVHGAQGADLTAAQDRLTRFSTGVRSFWVWATAPSKPLSIRLWPRCLAAKNRNGSTSCTPVGPPVWCWAASSRFS